MQNVVAVDEMRCNSIVRKIRSCIQGISLINSWNSKCSMKAVLMNVSWTGKQQHIERICSVKKLLSPIYVNRNESVTKEKVIVYHLHCRHNFLWIFTVKWKAQLIYRKQDSEQEGALETNYKWRTFFPFLLFWMLLHCPLDCN